MTQSHVCLTTSAASSELPHAAPARAPIVASTPPTPAPNETYADPPPSAPDLLSRQKLWGSVHTAPPGSRRAGTDPVHAGTGTPSSPTQLQELSTEQVADVLSPSSPDPHSHFISCLCYETVSKTLKYLGFKEGSKIPSWPSNLCGGCSDKRNTPAFTKQFLERLFL